MARNVLGIDATVTFAATCRYVDGLETPLCGQVLSDPVLTDHHHLAADMARHRNFAEKIVAAATNSSHGAPEMVVLVKPQIGFQGQRPARGADGLKMTTRRKDGKTVSVKTGDTSAVRRLGVHWELVRQFTDAGILVAEIGILTAEKVLTGRAAMGKAGRAPLEAQIVAMFPDLKLPQRDGKPDPRYRLTTVALALLGADRLDLQTPLDLDDAAYAALDLGSAFPPKLNTEKALTRTAEKNRRAEEYDEELAQTIYEMEPEEVVRRRPPRSPLALKAWKAQKALVEDEHEETDIEREKRLELDYERGV